jgi:hypothetical protein
MENNNKVSKIIPLCLIVLAIAIIGVGFLPAVGGSSYVNMFKCAFGGTLPGDNELKLSACFNFWIVMALFLPLIGALLSFFIKGKFGGILCLICFLYTAIFTWFTPMVAGYIAGASTQHEGWASFANGGLAVGSITMACIAIVGSLLSIYRTAQN